MIWLVLVLPALLLGVAAFSLAWRFLPLLVGALVFFVMDHSVLLAVTAMVLTALIQRQRRKAAPLPVPVRSAVRQERRRDWALEGWGVPWPSGPGDRWAGRRERVPTVPRPSPRAVTVPEAPAPDALSGAVDALLRQGGARLPAEARASVNRLRAQVAEAVALLGDGSPDGGRVVSEGALLTRQVALTYLPDTVAAYLRLPPSQADVPLPGGKSGRQLLQEQLGLLEAALGDVVRQAVQGEGESLLQQGRFLEARLNRRGGRKSDFEV